VDKAWASVKPEGVLWVRSSGKMDDAYFELSNAAYYGRYPSEITRVDEDVIAHPCMCSGAYSIDPSLFFDQLDLLYYLAHKDSRTLYNRMIPQEDKHNFMYGEDFNRQNGHNYYSGTLTVLAQKLPR
jgi:hypothetical protein